MFIERAVIEYSQKIEVTCDENEMTIRIGDNEIVLKSDELNEIISLAALMDWEGFEKSYLA